jgi:uncharacterized protein YjeT (DUF2065 family)
MSVNWSDLCAAFALYLVLEGIFPFLNPRGLKRTMLAITQLEDAPLRVFGLVSMLAGVALLYFIHR